MKCCNFRDWWFKKFGVKLEDDINQTLTSDEAEELWNCAYEEGYNKCNEWHDLKKNPKDLPVNEGWVCNQNGMTCYYDIRAEKWYCGEGTVITVTDWCHMPHKEIE